jgi:predicted nucleic acid-binding protein
VSSSLRRAVLLDSSAILALVDASDRHHHAAVQAARQLAKAGLAVFITPAIELEAHALLLRKVGRVVAREWLLRSGLDVLRPTVAEEESARSLIASHEDKDWSLCDATSFAVITSRKAAGAFSFVHHFQQAGRFKVWGLDPQRASS